MLPAGSSTVTPAEAVSISHSLVQQFESLTIVEYYCEVLRDGPLVERGEEKTKVSPSETGFHPGVSFHFHRRKFDFFTNFLTVAQRRRPRGC